MPINTNHWNDYLITLTNHQNILAQQIIHAYNQIFQQLPNQNKIGIQNINSLNYQTIKMQLSEQLAQKTKDVIYQWDNYLNDDQLIEWHDLTRPLLLFQHVPEAIAEQYCKDLKQINYQNFMYYQNLSSTQAEHDTKINNTEKVLFDCIIYLSNRLYLIIQTKQVS